MIKLKLLVGLAFGVAILAMSAAPAGAWFRSLNQQKNQGPITFGVITLSTGSATVSCQSASGEWHIQTKGPWWEHEVKNQNPELSKQVKTIQGPHLYIKIHQWNNCKAEVLAMKIPATISQCIFQHEQELKGATTATTTFVSACAIKIPIGKMACEIVVTPGNHAGVNELLKGLKLENSGQNVLGTIEMEGVHGEGESGKECKLGNFTNGKVKSEVGGQVAGGLEVT